LQDKQRALAMRKILDRQGKALAFPLSIPYLRWILIIPLTSATVASAVAVFLISLDFVTRYRLSHPALIFMLPLAGVVIVLLYNFFGKISAAGHGLVIEDLSFGTRRVEGRMAPLIVITTLLTHLFGGSAGREGSAVQIGAGIGHTLSRINRFTVEDRSLLLHIAIAAGFSAVFGTPLAAAIFALEIVPWLRFRLEKLLPVLASALLANYVTGLWNVHHTVYRIASLSEGLTVATLSWKFLAKIAFASLLFGCCSLAFNRSLHLLKRLWFRISSKNWVHPILGGAILIALVYLTGTRDYLGLGVTSPELHGNGIVNAFTPGAVTPWSWFWKFLFTAITLSAGFRGGEATPLFFVGACLGATLAKLLGLPTDLMAGLGFVAVYAAALNVPLAGAFMGAEIFGFKFFPYFFAVCYIAKYFAINRGTFGVLRKVP
jgi:H+/Cl- antiporter ClcA